ncbi:Rnase h, partial [Globisporangium splendens]
MYGFAGADLLGGHIKNLYDFVDTHGAALEIKTRVDILAITPATAVVRVDMEKDAADTGYTDFHTLVKIGGKWAVVAKVFHAFDTLCGAHNIADNAIFRYPNTEQLRRRDSQVRDLRSDALDHFRLESFEYLSWIRRRHSAGTLAFTVRNKIQGRYDGNSQSRLSVLTTEINCGELYAFVQRSDVRRLHQQV